MNRIGITQRISTHFHGQPHDCLDSAWIQLLLSLGLSPVPLPNIDAEQSVVRDYLSSCSLSGLILSGGNDVMGFESRKGSETAATRDAFEGTAVDWATAGEIPILAVCRGFQFINVHMGGSLSEVDNHVGTRHTVYRISDAPIDTVMTDLFSFEVNSFHNFSIAAGDLASSLAPIFLDEENYVEAAVGTVHRIAGIMWHPERESTMRPFDADILRALFLKS